MITNKSLNKGIAILKRKLIKKILGDNLMKLIELDAEIRHASNP